MLKRLPILLAALFLLPSTLPAGAMSWWKYQKVAPVAYQGRIVVPLHYDLQGQILEVPANTIIDFQGGSIRNGIIKGNNTKLENLQPDCLLCAFDGTFADMDVNADVFGLHPKGDGTVRRTPNQQEAFYRLNTLLPCVENLTLHFESGYYGFGGGGDTPQGEGPSSRLWFGHYAFYLYDYTGSSRLKHIEIDGGGATFLNVFPYYMGAWTKDGQGRFHVYKAWNTEDGEVENSRHATSGGGFICFSSNDAVNVVFHDFTIDMNRDIFQYGGYQYWTQSQCGISLATGGTVIINRVVSKNNVTDGVLILCQKRNGREIYPQKVSVLNSTFQNNVRLGLSLSVGQYNLVENCDFISNGRIQLVNDSYRFESPFSDIDIEPIIDRPFASVEIRNCRFRETNRHAIVSSRQNIRSIVVSNCSAENTLPRWDYGTEKDGKGMEKPAIVESVTEPLFINAQTVDTLLLENIDLTDVCLGYGCIFYSPRKDDKGVDGQFLVAKALTKRAVVKNVYIRAGGVFSPEVLGRRENKKDRVANLLYLSSSLQNFHYSSGRWLFDELSPVEYGYGGWDMEHVVYDVKDGYGIKGAAGWNKAPVSISSLTVNVLERRTRMPIFNFMFMDGSNGGISPKSGVRVRELIINDPINGFNTDVEEPSLSREVFSSILLSRPGSSSAAK